MHVIWPAALSDGVACAGWRVSSSVKRDPRQRVGSSSHIPTDVCREQNAPQSRTHKHARRHSKMSHRRLLNTDNSCTCTRSRRGAPLSQSTFARSHKGAGRICRPPSVRLHLLPFFFHPSDAGIKWALWPHIKKGGQKQNETKNKALSFFCHCYFAESFVNDRK